MGNLTQWLPLIGTVLAGILSALTPQITAWIAANPTAAALIGVIVAAASHFVPPPDTTPAPKG